MSYEEEELRVGIIEIFVEGQRKGRQDKAKRELHDGGWGPLHLTDRKTHPRPPGRKRFDGVRRSIRNGQVLHPIKPAYTSTVVAPCPECGGPRELREGCRSPVHLGPPTRCRCQRAA